MKLNTRSHPTNSTRPEPSQRIRIVSCVDNMRVGGTELNALRTAERLNRDRFDLSVICLDEEGPLRERYRDAGIPVRSFPISSLYGIATARQGWRLGTYLRSEGVQIVHTHDVYSNVFAATWARVFRTPVVIASRRWWNHVPRFAHSVGNRMSYAFAHRVLANSESVAALLAHAERVDPSRILVIPNFVDDAMFAQGSPGIGHELRARFGISPDALVVGTTARLHPVKDLSSLLRAVHMLVDQWPTLMLAVVGDGECRAALEAEAASLGIANRVRFTGMQPQHPNSHAAFDISVCCSTSEGFPNSVVEAMAAGRPVVATRVGGIPDAVVHEQTGLLVQPRNVSALADGIARLLRDPAMRREFGAAGEARARARFSAAGVISTLETAYEGLVREAGA